MQKLQFELSWDKTLSLADRKRIDHVFLETKLLKNKSIHFTPLWQAINHKSQLLVTVLVHNTSQQLFTFHNTKLRYLEGNEIIAEHSFTLPTLKVEPETSMPWTFIFPCESFSSGDTFEKGYLEIVGIS